MKTYLFVGGQTRCNSLSRGGDNHNVGLLTLGNIVDGGDGTSSLGSKRMERKGGTSLIYVAWSTHIYNRRWAVTYLLDDAGSSCSCRLDGGVSRYPGSLSIR